MLTDSLLLRLGLIQPLKDIKKTFAKHFIRLIHYESDKNSFVLINAFEVISDLLCIRYSRPEDCLLVAIYHSQICLHLVFCWKFSLIAYHGRFSCYFDGDRTFEHQIESITRFTFLKENSTSRNSLIFEMSHDGYHRFWSLISLFFLEELVLHMVLLHIFQVLLRSLLWYLFKCFDQILFCSLFLWVIVLFIDEITEIDSIFCWILLL